MTRTVIRVDQVTRRYFEAIGKSIPLWAGRLKKYPSFNKSEPLVMGTQIGSNPCAEIPMKLHTGMEIDSYVYIQPKRLHPEVPSGRMTGGTIRLEQESCYHVPRGDQHTQISIPKISDAASHGLIGQSARAIYDSPIFDDVTIIDVKSDDQATHFTVDVKWETMEVDIGIAVLPGTDPGNIYDGMRTTMDKTVYFKSAT